MERSARKVRGGADQIRRTSGVLVGGGGETAGLRVGAMYADAINRYDAIGVTTDAAPDACASMRLIAGPATSATDPSGQQLSQPAVRRAVDDLLSLAAVAVSGAAVDA